MMIKETTKGLTLSMRNFSKFILGAAVVYMAAYPFVTRSPIQSDDPNQVLLILPELAAPKYGSTPDFSAIKDVSEKKRAFFDFLLPGIRYENKRISNERATLLAMQEVLNSGELTSEQRAYAMSLGKLYGEEVAQGDINQAWLSNMLIKVNVLPESLVLTQAANESAWGTSRFAREANNYFGQWCYRPGCGLVPLQRTEGATHEVAKFSTAAGSIHAYFMNVNRNRAYRNLRKIRQDLVHLHQDLESVDSAKALTAGLLSYSERGQDYVNDLLTMIRVNHKYWSIEE